MSDSVEQIKSRLDVVDVISGYLKVQKVGRNFKARCPFHTEKTPSFYISPERQSWHCFGCAKGGDMFSFVQEIEGGEFVDALRTLAAKANVALPERHAGEHQEKSQRQVLLAVTELSTKFFEKQLWHSNAGAKALAYLRERGLTDDTIRAWRLGWAPNDWRALSGFLQTQKHAPDTIVAAGVAIQKEGRASLYDRFRSRIMFPIADAGGRIVGFTGRVFGVQVAVDGEPLAKYVNTPQTALYDKSHMLFGLDKAKQSIREKDACLLVEGNVDAILSSQAGAANVVATSGTALTSAQLHMLSRYSTTLDFCFDTDQAGKAATRRGIGLALAQNFNVRILTIRDAQCKDPADYVRAYGAQWNDVVASAKPALQYYYDEAVVGFDPSSVQHKKAIIASLGPLINRLASHVERGHWIDQLATLLRVEKSAVKTDLASVHDDIGSAETLVEEPLVVVNVHEELDTTEQEMLALLMRAPSLAAQLADIASMVDPRIGVIAADPALRDPAYTGEYRQLIDVAALRADQWWQEYTEAQLQEHMAVLVAGVRERSVRALRAAVEQEIRQAETAHDSPRLTVLVAQFQDYTTQLNQLQRIRSSTTP